MIMPKFKPCIDEYLETFSVLGQRKFLVHDLKLKKIPSGGGFHNWHYENGALSGSPRQFVVQVYLNDDFDGGETEFLYQQRREQAITGALLIFPAAFTHTHRGQPDFLKDRMIITGSFDAGETSITLGDMLAEIDAIIVNFNAAQVLKHQDVDIAGGTSYAAVDGAATDVFTFSGTTITIEPPLTGQTTNPGTFLAIGRRS